MQERDGCPSSAKSSPQPHKRLAQLVLPLSISTTTPERILVGVLNFQCESSGSGVIMGGSHTPRSDRRLLLREVPP